MFITLRWLAVVLFACTVFVGTAQAKEEIPPVKVEDKAKLFSAKAVEKADAVLERIRTMYRLALVVETIPEVPAADEAKFKKDQAAYFTKHAQQQFEERGLPGLYVAFWKTPTHQEVYLSDSLKKRFFPEDALKALRETLTKSQTAPDETLLGLVESVEKTLDAKFPINDQLKLFKNEQELRKAKEEIKRIQTQYGYTLHLETTDKSAPKTDAEKRSLWPGLARQSGLDDWARKRASELADDGVPIDGIYIVIIDGGAGKREVSVVPYPAGRGGYSGMSPEKCRQLRNVFLRKVDKGLFAGWVQPDRTLSEALARFARQTQSIKEPAPAPLTSSVALIITGAFLGGWVALVLFRWQFNSHRKPGEPEPVAIYQPAMMGTLFGVPAGFWVADELFRAIPPDVSPASSKDSDGFSLPPPSRSPVAPTTPPSEPFTLPPAE